MTVGGRNVHSQKVDRLSRRLEAQAGVGQYHNTQGYQKDCNDAFCVHNESTGRFFWSKRRLPAGNDPEQNRHNGEEEKDVDQAAGGAGHHPQRP
jgi:hypothetical protein